MADKRKLKRDQDFVQTCTYKKAQGDIIVRLKTSVHGYIYNHKKRDTYYEKKNEALLHPSDCHRRS